VASHILANHLRFWNQAMPAWLYSVNFSSPHPFPCEIWEKSWCWNLTLLKGLNETLSCFLHFSPYLVEFCLEVLHTRMLNNCELSTGQYSTEHTLGTGWRIWLRHFATSRKVGGSFPDGVIGNFHWRNLSGRTMALWLPQPLTEMSIRNISWWLKAAGA